MPRLMLLRHAKSAWPESVEDHERPLSGRGRQAASLMGRFMADRGLLPDMAFVSTARRAQETWQLLSPAFPELVRRRDERRIYESSAEAILKVIKSTPPSVGVLLVVGHNPGLQNLALLLAGPEPSAAVGQLRKKYPTAGLAVIDLDGHNWKKLAEGGGRLVRFETPKSIGS
jgi:phosphohistidine phosphatase